jgi:hypothetical protein
MYEMTKYGQENRVNRCIETMSRKALRWHALVHVKLVCHNTRIRHGHTG